MTKEQEAKLTSLIDFYIIINHNYLHGRALRGESDNAKQQIFNYVKEIFKKKPVNNADEVLNSSNGTYKP